MPSLADILAAEADAVSAFVVLLHEEQAALKAGSADALPDILARKNAAAAALAPIAQRRSASLAAAGADNGADAWFAQRPDDDSSRSAWQRLRELAAEAKEINRVNGELIRLRMAHNAQMLDALLAANRQELYGADGQTSAIAPRRIIDSA